MDGKANNGKRMNRGKFLGFLGKLGILSLIPGLPALSAPKTRGEGIKFLPPDLTDTRCGKLLRSPMIKGKTLSKAALTAKLTSENLENIRDLMTGRFFGKVAQDISKDGYKPFISWNLGTDGSDSGCFYYCDGDPESPSGIDNCGMYIAWQEDTGEVIVKVSGGDPRVASCKKCIEDCADQCESHCPGTYCEGGYCNPKRSIDLKEMMAFQDDIFVNEILEILETTDVRTVQAELKNVIFSDEVLNMGLEHFITNAYDASMGDV